jgi:NADP-dependent 3-hydroxy acid dehydrogenase YdfG
LGITVGAIQPGNTQSELWDQRPDLAEKEGLMGAENVAQVVLAMTAMPQNVNVLKTVVLPATMPFLGRG